MSELSQLTTDPNFSPVEKFREFLVTRNLRITREREVIVYEVFSGHEHFDTDEIVSRLGNRTDSKRVSRASVYRTLDLMVQAGLLRKVARPNGREVYEHDYGYPQHDHMICDKCGELIEFHNDEISDQIEKIASREGFLRTGHRLEVYGTCESCRRGPRRGISKLDLI